LDRLLQAASEGLTAQGSIKESGGAWLAAALAYIRTVQGCGWERDTTPTELVERCLVAKGWGWRWEGEDLELKLAGWEPPPPRLVAVQPSLFD
jgi:hypothetical protein